MGRLDTLRCNWCCWSGFGDVGQEDGEESGQQDRVISINLFKNEEDGFLSAFMGFTA